MLSLVVLFALVTPASEVERIQTHLATVEVELRAASTSTLSPEQRRRRATLIDELARYRESARFPRNLEHDRPTPFFIDDRGVRCAMAHLIETYGGAAFVARIAATANTAYVRELAGDEELRAWLADNGLTATEAARIQPTYPRGTGERCGGGMYCTAGICEPALDDPELAFCSEECEPNTSSCPVGLEDIQMECAPRGDRSLCVYPAPSPGTLGWPCDPDQPAVCAWSCAPIEGGGGVCAPACANDRACPSGFTCPAAEEATDYLRYCQVADDGCSASTATSWALAFLGVPLMLRRRRRSQMRSPLDIRRGRSNFPM